MAKPLNLDDYDEVAPARAPAPKPLDLSQYDEVAPAAPTAHWTGSVVPNPVPEALRPEVDFAKKPTGHSARDIALSAPPDEPEGPKRDTAADGLTFGDNAALAMGAPAVDYLAIRARREAMRNAPDDQVLFEGPRGPVTAGELRAMETAGDTVRQVGAGLAIGGPVAKLVGGKLAGAAMGPLQQAAATAGAGAVATTAADDLGGGNTPLEQIPGHLVESGVAGAALGAALATVPTVIDRAGRGAGQRIDERTFRDVGTGAKPGTQAAMLDAKPDVITEVQRLGVDPRDAAALRAAAKPAAAAAGAELESAYGAAEKPTLAQPLYDELVAIRDRYMANEATAETGAKLGKFLEKFASRRLPERPPADLVEPPEPRRLTDHEVVAELADGAPKATRAEAAKRIDDLAAAVNKFGLREHAADPRAMQAAQNAALDQVGKAIGKVDQAVTEASGGIPLPNVMRAIDKVAQKYSGPGTGGVADKVNALIEEIRAGWKDKFPVVNSTTRVPLPEVRRLSSQLGETAFTGDPSMPPNLAARVRRDLYGAVRDELNGHITDTLANGFSSSTYPGLQAEVGDFAQLNRDYSALKTLQKLTGKAAIDAVLAPAALPTTSTARAAPPAVPKSGRVPLSALRSMETALPENSPERAVISKAIADRIAEAPPEVGAKISKLSASQRALDLINEAADTRAAKDAFSGGSALSRGLKESGDKGTTTLGLVKGLAGKLTDPAARATDAALMKLALTVSAGNVTPQAIEAAVAAGVPRDVADSLVRRRQSPAAR